MYFVRPDPAKASSAGGQAGEQGPTGRSDGPSAEERQAEREQNGPVAQMLASTASFRVVDDVGEPIAGKKGKIVFSDGREVEFTSGSDGRFFISQLDPELTYELVLDVEDDGAVVEEDEDV